MAAKAGVRPSFHYSDSYREVNIDGTRMLLDFAKRRGIKQFIFASSSSVYGVNRNFPWKEEEELLPISPYASTKIEGERLGAFYSWAYGIRFLALRLFTVYRPAQRPDLAICKFLKAILSNSPISVYGNGLTIRDYTFIDDIVSGLKAAIVYEKSNFEIINLGNEKAITLFNVIETLESICEKKATLDFFPEQPGDVQQTSADISKARKLLNYQPKVNLRTGLLEFYRWYMFNKFGQHFVCDTHFKA